jgi:hypothetical protein
MVFRTTSRRPPAIEPDLSITKTIDLVLCWVAATTGAAGAVISSMMPSWVGLPCWHLSCSFLSLIISSLSLGDYPYNRVNAVSTQIIPDLGDIRQKIICVR